MVEVASLHHYYMGSFINGKPKAYLNYSFFILHYSFQLASFVILVFLTAHRAQPDLNLLALVIIRGMLQGKL